MADLVLEFDNAFTGHFARGTVEACKRNDKIGLDRILHLFANTLERKPAGVLQRNELITRFADAVLAECADTHPHMRYKLVRKLATFAADIRKRTEFNVMALGILREFPVKTDYNFILNQLPSLAADLPPEHPAAMHAADFWLGIVSDHEDKIKAAMARDALKRGRSGTPLTITARTLLDELRGLRRAAARRQSPDPGFSDPHP